MSPPLAAPDAAALALALGAGSIGALHSLAPDHWVPFAALARARGWSALRTAQVTVLCGLGHVTVSAALGLCALWLGMKALLFWGERLESAAGLLLVAFGLAYGAWGVRRAVRHQLELHTQAQGGPHHHGHAHGDRASAFTLFLLFCADPCVAVMPLLFAAAPLGVGRAAAVVLTYEVSTLAAMVTLVLLARAGARALRAPWLDRYGDGAAGGVIAAVGLLVTVLGW